MKPSMESLIPLHKQQFIDLLAAYDQSRTWFRRLFTADPEVIDNFRRFVVGLADTEAQIADDQLFPLISLLDTGLRDESFEPIVPTELFEGLILKAEAEVTQLSESIKATQSADHAADASKPTAEDEISSPPRPSR